MKKRTSLKNISNQFIPGLLLAGALVMCSTVSNQAELVLRYNFDEESGDALDLGSAPAANGSFVNAAVRTNNTPSGTGYALDVAGPNGTSHYVVSNPGDPAKLNDLTNGITLTWWMNLKALPAVSDRIMEKLSGTGGFGVRFGTPTATSTTVALGVNTTGGTVSSPAITNLNSWIFCAVTYDATKLTQNAQFFLGSQTTPATGAALQSYGRGPITNITGSFRVGSTPATSADRTPPAWFDDVRVYNTVLPIAEIEGVRQAGGGTVPLTPSVLSFTSNLAGYNAPGGNVNFTATVLGQGPMSIFWQLNGRTLRSGTVVSNANIYTSSYSITNLTPEYDGVYTVLVTNAAGSVTSAPIALNVTTLYATEVLTNLWTLDPIYFYLTNNNAERGMTYVPVSKRYPGPGSLVVAHFTSASDFGLVLLNAETGAFIDGDFLLPAPTMNVGTRTVNLVGAAEDGAIFVGNLTTTATNPSAPYYLYRYESDDYGVAPTVAFTGDPGAPNYPGLRWGDSMAVRGSGTGTEVLLAPAGDLIGFQSWQTNVVALLRTTDGTTFTSTVIRITNGPTAFANVGVAFGPGTNTFFAKQINAPLRLFEFDANSGLGWVKHEYDLEAIPGSGSAMALSPDGTKLGELFVETPDNFRYYHIADFAGTPELLDQEIFPLNYPNATSGGIGAVAFGNNGRIYVLNSANGIKAFAPNNAYTPPSPFNITDVESDSEGTKVSWTAQSGKTYQVLSSDSLSPTRWSRASLPVTGDGSIVAITNRIQFDGANMRYYRVRGQ